MESARAITVLIQAEFQHTVPRMGILEGLFEQFTGLMGEEEPSWAVLRGSGLIVSIMELLVT